MNDSSLNANPPEDLQPDIDATYRSFRMANELLNASQQILDLANHLTGAENCSLMLLNGHGMLYVLNSRGLNAANLRASQSKLGDGIAGRVAMEGMPLMVDDISADARFSLYRRSRYRTESFIACPITSREKIIGVLNLTDKKSGEPFNQDDLSQAKLVSKMASVALQSFQGGDHLKFRNCDIDELYRRLVEAEYKNHEFVARISLGMHTPLNRIKGAVYSLKSSVESGKTRELEYYDIIEKEVEYLISYLDEGARDYDRTMMHLANIEERTKFRKLLEDSERNGY